jgi:hypothetical protein
MRASTWLLVGAVGLSAAAAARADEGGGLSLTNLQARVRVDVEGAPASKDHPGLWGGPGRVSGASMLGDYYFDRSDLRGGDSAGLRATSGIFLGSRLGMWGGSAPATLSSSLVKFERQNFSLLATAPGTDRPGADSGAVPYLGLGYSGASLKGGWAFSADLGVMSLNPAGAIALGRVFGGGQTLDELVRELRLSPVIQVGASYAF